MHLEDQSQISTLNKAGPTVNISDFLQTKSKHEVLQTQTDLDCFNQYLGQDSIAQTLNSNSIMNTIQKANKPNCFKRHKSTNGKLKEDPNTTIIRSLLKLSCITSENRSNQSVDKERNSLKVPDDELPTPRYLLESVEN